MSIFRKTTPQEEAPQPAELSVLPGCSINHEGVVIQVGEMAYELSTRAALELAQHIAGLCLHNLSKNSHSQEDAGVNALLSEMLMTGNTHQPNTYARVDNGDGGYL